MKGAVLVVLLIYIYISTALVFSYCRLGGDVASGSHVIVQAFFFPFSAPFANVVVVADSSVTVP